MINKIAVWTNLIPSDVKGLHRSLKLLRIKTSNVYQKFTHSKKNAAFVQVRCCQHAVEESMKIRRFFGNE